MGPSECREQVKNPELDPPAGAIDVDGPIFAVGAVGSQVSLRAIRKLFLNVSISVQPPTAVIKYTRNGSDPITKGTVYDGVPLQLKGGTTNLRAVAVTDVQWPYWSPDKTAMQVVSSETNVEYILSVCQDGIRTLQEECDGGIGGGQGCSMECCMAPLKMAGRVQSLQ